MFNVKVTPVIVTARSAGRAIVEEAIARRSEVIVLGSQGKRRIADKVFGRTIDYVLANLPCEAIINVIPKHAVTGMVGTGAAATTVVTAATAASQEAQTKRGAAVVSEASGGAAGGSERLKRRAQGLRLGRYVPSRSGVGGAAAGSAADDGDGSPASPPDEAPVDAGTRDSGAV